MTEDKKSGPSINVTSNQQRGGITAYSVSINIGGRLTFSSDIAEAVKSKMPIDKPVIVTVIGGEKDKQVASEYLTDFVNSGYNVKVGSLIGNKSPPADDKIEVYEFKDYTALQIAPSA